MNLFLKIISISALFFFGLNAFAEKKCNWDSDCGTGYHCNNSTNECKMGKWPDGGCSWDSDCLTGYHCDAANECKMGKWPDGGCNWDSDCLTGYYCNNATNECRMGKWPDGGCNWDSDCLTGYECEQNECEKSTFVEQLLQSAMRTN